MTSIMIDLTDEDAAAMSAAADAASQPLSAWIARVCRERIAEDEVLRPELGLTDGVTRAALLLHLSEFGFSSRIMNALQNHRIGTVRELVSETRTNLLKMRNMGRTSVEQIESTLARHGLRLGLSLPKRYTAQ